MAARKKTRSRTTKTAVTTHAATKKKGRAKRTITPWTAADLKSLRKEAGRTPAAKLAKLLKRTEGALRQKASALGISLRLH